MLERTASKCGLLGLNCIHSSPSAGGGGGGGGGGGILGALGPHAVLPLTDYCLKLVHTVSAVLKQSGEGLRD